MYKVGDKFIIEIGGEYPENPFEDGENGKAPTILYKIKGFNSLVFDENGLDKLVRYDVAQEAAYDDGFEAGTLNAKDKGYEKGLSDAWEYVKKIYDLSFSNTKEIYGEENDSLLKVMRNLTPQEAIEKLKAWGEKRDIKVGDVISSTSGSVAVVQYVDSRGMWLCFGKSCYFTLDHEEQRYWEKTSKHIDLTEIFKALEGEDAD